MIYVRGLKRSERAPDRVSRAAMRRHSAALAGSLTFHLLFFLLAFGTASGGLMSAAGASGGPTGPVFTVTVVRMPPTTGSQRPAASGLQPLFAKLRVAAGGTPLPFKLGEHPSDIGSLVEQVRSQQPTRAPPETVGAERQAADQGSRHPSPRPLSRSLSDEDALRDADGDATAANPSTGKLWGAIEPCWRNLGARGRVRVVLEVVLDSTGDLRTPPRVIRDPAALVSEPRLQAEANALAAVAACAPRGDLRFGGRTYRLEFPATP